MLAIDEIKQANIDGVFAKGQVRLDRLSKAKRRQLLRLYKESLDEIKSQIASLVEKLGGDVSLSNAHRYNRLRNLETNIRAEIQRMTGQAVNITGGAIKDAFTEGFNLTGYAVESSLLVKGGFGSALDKNAITSALYNPLDLIKWPERMRAHSNQYMREIRQEIAKGLVQGKGYGPIAKSVKSRADIGAGKLIRIINTETHRAVEQGTLKGYERINDNADKLGIDTQKKWVSTLDDKTRDTHQSLDGQIAEEKDGVEVFTSSGGTAEAPGLFGIPSEDINCRCTTSIVIEGVDEGKYRRARENGKNVLRPNMTYCEWAKARGVKAKGCKGKTRIDFKAPKKAKYKPSMSRVEAEAWAKNSKFKDDLYHITKESKAQSIKDNGFNLTQLGFGRLFGDGVYLAENRPTGKFYVDKITESGGKAKALRLKANIKNPLSIDVSDIEPQAGFWTAIEGKLDNAHKGIVKRIRELEWGYIRGNDDIFKNAPYAGRGIKLTESQIQARAKYFERMRRAGEQVSDPKAKAVTVAMQEFGYDSFEILDKYIRTEFGGSQLVVFNPQNVTVITP